MQCAVINVLTDANCGSHSSSVWLSTSALPLKLQPGLSDVNWVCRYSQQTADIENVHHHK